MIVPEVPSRSPQTTPEGSEAAEFPSRGDRRVGGMLVPPLYLILWLGCYVGVVIAWGQRNAWPDDLLLCVMAMPINLVTAWLIYDEFGFETSTDPYHNQQEQLVAALLLAVGVASGERLFMALGLIALAVSWMRPRREGSNWSEWLKLPLLLLTSLPVWQDLAGADFFLARLFADPASNPPFRLIWGIETNQAAMLGYFGLVAMILLLPGPTFWRALPVLPLFVTAMSLVPRWIPGWHSIPAPRRMWLPWIAGVGVLYALHRALGRTGAPASPRPHATSLLARWFMQRRYPPWIAIVVVAAVQAPRFEPLRWNLHLATSLVGMATLVVLLLWLRRRTPRGPIHSRSVVLVAGSLAMVLIGEFTTTDAFRQVGLGLALLGLLSWHCFWPQRILVPATLVTVLLAGMPDSLPIRWITADGLLTLRAVGGVVLLAITAWFARAPLPRPGETGYDEQSWIPFKRFGFVLLGLMLVFQIAGAFWPDHDLPRPSIHEGIRLPDTTLDAIGEDITTSRNLGPTQITTTHPRQAPSLLESPEQIYRRRGWTVMDRRFVPHPRGEAAYIRVTREGTTAAALWWFEQSGKAFPSHRMARRILWSSWHLAARDLRLVRMESSVLLSASELAGLAERNGWFNDDQAPPDRPAESGPR